MKRVDKTLYPVHAGAWSGGRIQLTLKGGDASPLASLRHRHRFTDEVEDAYSGVINMLWHDLHIVTDPLIRATPRRTMMNELNAAEEDYMASIRVEKAAYNRLLTAQEELAKAAALHQHAREGCINCLRKLNYAMKAASG